jgi:hypothetical protein
MLAMSETVNEHTPEVPRRRPVPGVVLATVVLLYVGGGLVVLTALVNGHWKTLAEQLTNGSAVGFGALNIVLAYHLYKRRRWARTTVLVLCGIGVALGIVRVIGAGARGVQSVVWPIVYAVLLSTPRARAWFAGADPDEEIV